MNDYQNTNGHPADLSVRTTLSFEAAADRFAANIAAATQGFAGAGQDLVAMIESLVNAGRELESSLAVQRNLGAAALRSVEDARAAAVEAAASTAESRELEASAKGLVSDAEKEFGTVSWLVTNLQQRIAALAVLAGPIPTAESEEASPSADDSSDPEVDGRDAAEMLLAS